MLLRLQVIFICLVWVVSSSDYTANHIVNCSDISANGDSFDSNLRYLWNRAILHMIDRYVFLAICPILLILQLITITIYCQNKRLIAKPGNIFLAIVMFQFLMNIHFLASASKIMTNLVFYTIFETDGPMPEAFPIFCSINSIYISFVNILHTQFILLFPIYIIYVLRFTLKSKSKIWNMIYALTLLLAVSVTYIFWNYDLLGLNIFGLCGITFIRNPAIAISIPLIALMIVIVFLGLGLFTLNYFKKHMPNTIGLRRKKYQENRLLIYYIVGYSVYLTFYLGIDILEFVGCIYNPSTVFMPFITVFNLLRITQFLYIFFVIFKNQLFRANFKKFWKKLFIKKRSIDDQITLTSKTSSFYQSEDDSLNFEQFFLEIKQDNNQIDILKISQVVTIVSGIYVAYKQYYNIKDEYFNILIDPEVSGSDPERQNIQLKPIFFRKAKKIYYHEKMSVKLDAEIVKDFIHDLSLIPHLGILQCTMIIHSPKIFQLMLENDRLQNIFQSFQLHDNTKKMFDLVEGQGGRSGEFFFFSHDNKYVLKTITQQQFNFIEQNLFYFHEHYQRNPNSILAKIYGLFTFKGNEIQRTYHLILMKNILGCPRDKILRTYDLKGSKYDREVANDTMTNELENYTLKDIDFMKMEGRLSIKNDTKVNLREIMEKDSIFLRNLNLIDYSFLVVKVKWEVEAKNPQFWGNYQRIQSANNENVYYHLGIIDYLQRWDLQKKGQKWWKNMMGKKDISAQKPKKYQNRFMTFIAEITQDLSNNDLEVEMYNIERKERINDQDFYRFHDKFKLFSDQIGLQKKLSPFSEYDPQNGNYGGSYEGENPSMTEVRYSKEMQLSKYPSEEDIASDANSQNYKREEANNTNQQRMKEESPQNKPNI